MTHFIELLENFKECKCLTEGDILGAFSFHFPRTQIPSFLFYIIINTGRFCLPAQHAFLLLCVFVSCLGLGPVWMTTVLQSRWTAFRRRCLPCCARSTALCTSTWSSPQSRLPPEAHQRQALVPSWSRNGVFLNLLVTESSREHFFILIFS